MLLVAWKISY